MKATKAILVTVNGVVEIAIENLLAAAEVRGYTWSGKVHQNARTREEMQDQPIFNELCGPMYQGPGIVRYEDSEMNEQLSR